MRPRSLLQEKRSEPEADCPLCPRLAGFRHDQRRSFPDWHNAPVPSFGEANARLLIVGLAPGLRGANCTGRPFTGDHAGTLLYPTLLRHGFARGAYAARIDDGLELVDCRITNAVRCVPPENRPVGAEINACRAFLAEELERPEVPRVVLSLGGIAHASVVRTLGLRLKDHPFKHGAIYDPDRKPRLAASYHCSRYNLNTGRLTPDMFDAVVARVRALVDADRNRAA